MTLAVNVSLMSLKPPRLMGWLFGISLLLAGCSVSEQPRNATFSGVAFFSMSWQVRVSDLPAKVNAQQLQVELQQALDDANKVLSTYQPDTELMRFNAADVNQWIVVSDMLLSTVRSAVVVSAKTQGRYDMTVGPLVNLWGFGPQARPERIPSDAMIAAAKAQIGWEALVIDQTGSRLKKLKPVHLDASSLGEGVGVQVLEAVLQRHGMRNYLVSVAGVTLAKGVRSDGMPWRVAVEVPDGSGKPLFALPLRDAVISTSGSYRNYYELDGVHYSHTIDPLTGYPVRHKGVSVTVVLEGVTPVMVDAWATALNVLGPQAGLALAEQEGLAAHFVEKSADGFIGTQSSFFGRFLTAE